jgi:hypothetical protein
MLEDLEEQKENSILAKKELKPLKDKKPIQNNSACGRGVRGVNPSIKGY